MRSDFVVMTSKVIDADSRVELTKFAVERFGGRDLPRLVWIDQHSVDAGVSQPA